MKRLLIALLLACVLCGSASADIQMVSIPPGPTFSYHAPELYTIYQVSVNDLYPGVANIAFYSYEGAWNIEINATKNVVGWWSFEISMLYPNGTTAWSDTIGSWAAASTDYDAKFQYVDGELDFIDVDIYIDFSPAIGTLTDPLYYESLEGRTREIIYFEQVAGTLPNEATVNIRLCTEDEKEALQEGSLPAQIARTASGLWEFNLEGYFSWTWDVILAFVLCIPYVGEYLVFALEMTAGVLYELAWYLNFFLIENPEVTFFSIECIILAHALNSGRSLIGMLRIVYKDHVTVISGIMRGVEIMRDTIIKVIEFVTSVINALKPV